MLARALPSTPATTTTRGIRTLAMVIRTTTIRLTIALGCAPFGILNKNIDVVAVGIKMPTVTFFDLIRFDIN